jgi:hypothetical protein
MVADRRMDRHTQVLCRSLPIPLAFNISSLFLALRVDATATFPFRDDQPARRMDWVGRHREEARHGLLLCMRWAATPTHCGAAVVGTMAGTGQRFGPEATLH